MRAPVAVALAGVARCQLADMYVPIAFLIMP